MRSTIVERFCGKAWLVCCKVFGWILDWRLTVAVSAFVWHSVARHHNFMWHSAIYIITARIPLIRPPRPVLSDNGARWYPYNYVCDTFRAKRVIGRHQPNVPGHIRVEVRVGGANRIEINHKMAHIPFSSLFFEWLASKQSASLADLLASWISINRYICLWIDFAERRTSKTCMHTRERGRKRALTETERLFAWNIVAYGCAIHISG